MNFVVNVYPGDIMMADSKKPFHGQVFYFDIKGYKDLDVLEESICELGGKVEKFLCKEVTRVVSDSRTNARKHSSVESASPMCVSRLSRGQRLLSKARNTDSHDSHSHVLTFAAQWAIDIVPLKKVLQVIKLHGSDVSRKTARRTKCVNVKRLKGPFIKYEHISRDYKPSYMSFMAFPVLHVDESDEHGGSPFYAPIKKTAVNKVTKKDQGTTGPPPAVNNRENTPHTKVTETKAKRDKQSNSGYCECCDDWFKELSAHLASDKHQRFADNDNNYTSVDSLLAELPGLSNLLQAESSDHCVHIDTGVMKPSQDASDDTVFAIVSQCLQNIVSKVTELESEVQPDSVCDKLCDPEVKQTDPEPVIFTHSNLTETTTPSANTVAEPVKTEMVLAKTVPSDIRNPKTAVTADIVSNVSEAKHVVETVTSERPENKLDLSAEVPSTTVSTETGPSTIPVTLPAVEGNPNTAGKKQHIDVRKNKELATPEHIKVTAKVTKLPALEEVACPVTSKTLSGTASLLESLRHSLAEVDLDAVYFSASQPDLHPPPQVCNEESHVSKMTVRDSKSEPGLPMNGCSFSTKFNKENLPLSDTAKSKCKDNVEELVDDKVPDCGPAADDVNNVMDIVGENETVSWSVNDIIESLSDHSHILSDVDDITQESLNQQLEMFLELASNDASQDIDDLLTCDTAGINLADQLQEVLKGETSQVLPQHNVNVLPDVGPVSGPDGDLGFSDNSNSDAGFTPFLPWESIMKTLDAGDKIGSNPSTQVDVPSIIPIPRVPSSANGSSSTQMSQSRLYDRLNNIIANVCKKPSPTTRTEPSVNDDTSQGVENDCDESTDCYGDFAKPAVSPEHENEDANKTIVESDHEKQESDEEIDVVGLGEADSDCTVLYEYSNLGQDVSLAEAPTRCFDDDISDDVRDVTSELPVAAPKDLLAAWLGEDAMLPEKDEPATRGEMFPRSSDMCLTDDSQSRFSSLQDDEASVCSMDSTASSSSVVMKINLRKMKVISVKLSESSCPASPVSTHDSQDSCDTSHEQDTSCNQWQVMPSPNDLKLRLSKVLTPSEHNPCSAWKVRQSGDCKLTFSAERIMSPSLRSPSQCSYSSRRKLLY